MARSIFVSLLFFVALLVGLTSSNAQGTGVSGNSSATVQLNITGRIVCGLLGNPIPALPSPPLVGVNVTLSCNNRTVAQALTNSTGFFQLTVNVTNLLSLDIPSCRVVVPLPVNASCIILPIFGSLRAAISLTAIVQTGLGIVLNFVTLPFVFLPL